MRDDIDARALDLAGLADEQLDEAPVRRERRAEALPLFDRLTAPRAEEQNR